MGDIAARTPASGSAPAPPGSSTLRRPKPQKTILVLASAQPPPALVDELRTRCLDTETQVLVVAPAPASGLGLWMNDDRWRSRAEEIVERTTGMLAAARIPCRGRLEDADARQVLDDALRADEVAEIIVVDSPLSSSIRLEDLALRADAGRELASVTFVPPAQAASSPPRVPRRRARRVALAATAPVVALAFALAVVGFGGSGLLAGLGFVVGVIAVNVGSKIAVLGALWLAARRWLLRPPPA